MNDYWTKVSMPYDAQIYASIAHAKQTYQNDPYYFHPVRVESLLIERGFTEDKYRVVALLHDVVEDCPGYTVEMIRERYGDEVADAVDAITRRKYEDGTKESEDSYLIRVAANTIALEVKIADMCDNLLMTRSPNCPPEKRRLWLKYVNAIQFLLKVEMNERT